MKKPVKLVVYLLVCAALTFLLWARMDCPRLSAESALRRAESANLAPKSTFLKPASLGEISVMGSGDYKRYLVTGVTDTHLHMAQMRKKGLFWYCEDSSYRPLASVPLDDGPVTGIAPNYWPFDHFFFLYTPQLAESWVATVTIGDLSYTTEGTCDPSGFTLFEFHQLDHCSEAVSNNLSARAYDMIGMGYNKDSKNMDISLTVALFATDGQPVGFASRDYPVS